MKAIIRLLLLAIGFTVVLTLSANPGFAQEKPDKEIVNPDKKLLIGKNMQLTESEAKVFWPIYEDYQKELNTLLNRTVNLIRGYIDSYQNMSDPEAKRLLDDFILNETKRLALMQSYLPKFRKVLSEKKVTRYYQQENKIYAAMICEIAEQIPVLR